MRVTALIFGLLQALQAPTVNWLEAFYTLDENLNKTNQQ